MEDKVREECSMHGRDKIHIHSAVCLTTGWTDEHVSSIFGVNELGYAKTPKIYIIIAT
jgi:hypothetical protein